MPDQTRKRTLDSSTRLSFERTRLSYDRTMMSWIRTATSLVTFGFAIYKFFQLEMGHGASPNHLIGSTRILTANGRHWIVIAAAGHPGTLAGHAITQSGIPRTAALANRRRRGIYSGSRNSGIDCGHLPAIDNVRGWSRAHESEIGATAVWAQRRRAR